MPEAYTECILNRKDVCRMTNSRDVLRRFFVFLRMRISVFAVKGTGLPIWTA